MGKDIINISITALKVHPRNTEFFDDISGEDYETFKKSIEQEGVITPLVVSPNMTIVSGHQRLKACMDLHIDTVPIIIRDDLKDETEILKVLLAANFGRLKNDETKQRKVAVMYYELCGNGHGGARGQLGTLKEDLEEIAKRLGTTGRSLKRAIRIEKKLTPEIIELVDMGKVSKITASDILAKLSKEDQQSLLEDLGKEQLANMTQNQVQEYIDKIQGLENQIKGYELKEQKRSQLQDNPSLEQSNDTTIEELMEEKNKLEAEKRKEYERAEKLQKESEQKKKEVEQLKEQITQIESLQDKQNDDNAIKKIEDAQEYKDLLAKLYRTQSQLDTAQFKIKNMKPNKDIQKDFNIFELKELVHKFSNNISIYEYDPDIVNQGSLPDREELLVAISELWGQLESIKNNIKGVTVA